jgi:hypothetical protein
LGCTYGIPGRERSGNAPDDLPAFCRELVKALEKMS